MLTMYNSSQECCPQHQIQPLCWAHTTLTCAGHQIGDLGISPQFGRKEPIIWGTLLAHTLLKIISRAFHNWYHSNHNYAHHTNTSTAEYEIDGRYVLVMWKVKRQENGQRSIPFWPSLVCIIYCTTWVWSQIRRVRYAPRLWSRSGVFDLVCWTSDMLCLPYDPWYAMDLGCSPVMRGFTAGYIGRRYGRHRPLRSHPTDALKDIECQTIFWLPVLASCNTVYNASHGLAHFVSVVSHQVRLSNCQIVRWGQIW